MERDAGPTRERVLIVDDEEEARHALRLLFEIEGFDVVGEATNGLEAVALAMVNDPHFIVLDYRMPVMDGAHAARLLRSVSPDARIVAFSAVIETKPTWADAFLTRDRIGEVAPLVKALLDTSPHDISAPA